MSEAVVVPIGNKAAREELEQDVLMKKSQTLESQNKLLFALTTTEWVKQKESGHIINAETTSRAGPKVNSRDKRKSAYPQPYTASLDAPSTRDVNTRPKILSDHPPNPELVGRDANKKFKNGGDSRCHGGYLHPSTGKMSGDRRGPQSSKRTVHDHLERRVKELEREIKNMGQKRHR
ncbi:hypothetical protein F5Y09DRAFT_241252 [Xylaria sp. FL1042]|nr:hypothetical protein F5Y09DRAFT_241252 [Xylaria sp. FL1042]